jgi:hypothetical protein
MITGSINLTALKHAVTKVKTKEGKEVDTFGRENTLRSQYLDKTKDYTGIAQAFAKVESADTFARAT